MFFKRTYHDMDLSFPYKSLNEFSKVYMTTRRARVWTLVGLLSITNFCWCWNKMLWNPSLWYMYGYLFHPYFHPYTALFHPVCLLKLKQFEKKVDIGNFISMKKVIKVILPSWKKKNPSCTLILSCTFIEFWNFSSLYAYSMLYAYSVEQSTYLSISS